ncbi:hypothetical protein MTO96_004654 [Rhipicephalus appendiculatus]
MYLNGAAQSRANLFTDDRAASHVSTMLRMSALAVLLVLAISLQDASAQGKPSLSSGTCRNFIYGGCQGNENRFSSREECLQTCG